MGLLTDPNNRQRGALTQFILSHHTKLSWLCFLAGGFTVHSSFYSLYSPSGLFALPVVDFFD